MPKVVKMPIPDQQQNSEVHATSEFSGVQQAMLLPFRTEPDDALDMITRWINLADQVLSSDRGTRKRA